MLAVASSNVRQKYARVGTWASCIFTHEGHEIVALIAQAFLEPEVRTKVDRLLATDTDPFTAHDIASEATWADRFRDENQNGAWGKTRLWHFVDIEIGHPDIDAACFGYPRNPARTAASNGPAQDCVVDKDARSIASDLIGHISKAQQQEWSQGTATDWAQDTFRVARDVPKLLDELGIPEMMKISRPKTGRRNAFVVAAAVVVINGM